MIILQGHALSIGSVILNVICILEAPRAFIILRPIKSRSSQTSVILPGNSHLQYALLYFPKGENQYCILTQEGWEQVTASEHLVILLDLSVL